MKKIFSLSTAFVLFFTACGLHAAADDDISAKAYVLIEAGTGTVIEAGNEHMKLPMASITKIMSALLTLESGDLDLEFEVDSVAVMEEGSSMGLLPGDIVTKRALCYGMLLPSGNDAANASAVSVAGDYARFARLMNARAAQIGMRRTNFVTSSGLHAAEHYSTAYDMALLTREALKNEAFKEICSAKSAKLSFGNPPYERWLTNTNRLLSSLDGCIGVKTGFTDEAGRCLVSAVYKDGVTLICVTLNAPDDWNDHAKLYQKGFSSVLAKEIPLNPEGLSVNVVGGDADFVSLTLGHTPRVTVINGQTPEVTASLITPRFIYAPVTKGDIVGTMRFYSGGNMIDEVTVIAEGESEAVIIPPKRNLYELIIDFVKDLIWKR
ncbi:MAG: D-alanyl-D-alanine carboxypeptidase [Oscillospiraceae bacterium]|nr:D-alanyl-D-alanine carboxypeptidase [Oscillospiraceae bacterium]